MLILSKEYFYNEKVVFEYVESILWLNGFVCFYCGNFDKYYKFEGVCSKLIKKSLEGIERYGFYKCVVCCSQFMVCIGMIFEESYLLLYKWLQVIYLICFFKKGISVNQFYCVFEVMFKMVWFFGYCICEVMCFGFFEFMGGVGKIIEVDEIYFGDKEVVMKCIKCGKFVLFSKCVVIFLVECGGFVWFFYVDCVDKMMVFRIVWDNIDCESVFYIDESCFYMDVCLIFVKVEIVVYSVYEYVCGDVYMNIVEGFYLIFKCGMKGVYQYCSEKYLYCYFVEFDFWYNNCVVFGVNDSVRVLNVLVGVRGKWLIYEGFDKIQGKLLIINWKIKFFI